MNQSGGYDYELVATQIAPEDFTCVFCHYILKGPVQIEECGHIFCKDCFEQMKLHSVANSLPLYCPLDRGKIDQTHVFKDKSTERKILNLKVKCPNYGDNCTWIGELRKVQGHEKNCSKNKAKNDEAFEMTLEQLLNEMTNLATKVESNQQKLIEKDQQILIQCQQSDAQTKHIGTLNTHIVNLSKDIESLNKDIKQLAKHTNDQNITSHNLNKLQVDNQNKTIEGQNKQIKDQKIQVVNQNNQIEDQNRRIKDLENQNKRIKAQNKQIEEQNKQIKDLNKQMIYHDKQLEKQGKQIEDQNKQREDQNKRIKDQAVQIKHFDNHLENRDHQIKLIQECHTQMIMPNVYDIMNYSPIYTHFQWKFNPAEIKSSTKTFSPPFYNIMNSHCFQLGVTFISTGFSIVLHRYRGKYDLKIGESIITTEEFTFNIHLFGTNGKQKKLEYDNTNNINHIGKYLILERGERSKGCNRMLSNVDIDSLIIESQVTLYCFFK